MNHPLLVRVLNGIGNLDHQSSGDLWLKGTARQSFAQGATWNVLHTEERSPAMFARIENGHDVGMTKSGHDSRLGCEPDPAVGTGGNPADQHIYCNNPVKSELPRQVYRPHPTLPELAGHFIAWDVSGQPLRAGCYGFAAGVRECRRIGRRRVRARDG